MSRETEYYISANEDGFHKVAYHIWGPEDGTPLVAVHGLTCNGRDFGPLARTLAEDGIRFIAIDLPGRGKSDTLEDHNNYNQLQYIADITGLLTHLGYMQPQAIDWLGVSLGGLLGMILASLPESPVRRLILNDIGPEIPPDFLAVLKKTFHEPHIFNSQHDLTHTLRTVTRASWGKLDDDHWREMGINNTWFAKDDTFTFAFDHAIIKPFTAIKPDEPVPTLWPCWEAITCPTLVLQGEESIVLPRDLIKKMRESGPAFDFHSFRDCGHVPSLIPEHQKDVVRQWLKNTPTS